MNELLTDSSNIIGHIYLITNIETNLKYIGQTLSHRKNHNKYRPFGYEGRFKDHISEALCNTKKKQCNYLNNAIRKYGKDKFKVELITTCSKEELNIYEEIYIEQYNTLYPNGYNLTTGGKVFKTIIDDITPNKPSNIPKKRGGCSYRSLETRTKMTNSLKMVFGTSEARREQMLRSQKQHSNNKLIKFKNANVDMTNLEQYIRIRNKKDGSKFIKIIIGDISTQFNGKYETIEELKEKAIDFLKSVNSATLPNCSGNP